MSSLHIGLFFWGLALVITIHRHVWPDRPSVLTDRWFFCLTLSLALFGFQWNTIHANFQLWNPDESEMIAGALTLQHRPVFWRDVDGNSHGPLNQLPLLIPALVGARIDYTSARIIGALLVIIFMSCLHEALTRQISEPSARLVVLPGWAFFIFNQDPEIAQYTSELPASCLLAAAFALYPDQYHPSQNWRVWLAGIACGCAPLAKLQAAPLAAWVPLCLLCAHGLPGRHQKLWSTAPRLIAGAMLPALFFIGLAAATGAFSDFYIRYLQTNLIGYVAEGYKFFNTRWPDPASIFGLSQFLWPLTVIIAASGGWLVWRRLRCNLWFLLPIIGLVAITLIAIFIPQRPFAHYFLLLVGPLTLLLGATAGPILDSLRSRFSRQGCLLATLVILLGLTGFSSSHRLQHPGYLREVLPTRPAVSRALIESLQARTQPGQALAVWGWQPALYVFTQTISATRELIIFWQVVPNQWQDYYLQSYLRDLQTNPPEIFIDVMGPDDFYFKNGLRTRHDNFPALQAFIAQNYRLVDEVSSSRIYEKRPTPACLATRPGSNP